MWCSLETDFFLVLYFVLKYLFVAKGPLLKGFLLSNTHIELDKHSPLKYHEYKAEVICIKVYSNLLYLSDRYIYGY